MSQNDFRVHFGLGAAGRVDRVDVRWPNGREEWWENLTADRFHEAREKLGEEADHVEAVKMVEEENHLEIR